MFRAGFVFMVLCAGLAGCTMPELFDRPAAVEYDTSPRTPEDFDQDAAVRRVEVTTEGKPAPTLAGGEERLGQVIASLGDPTAKGLWARTPLVKQARPGRLYSPKTGISVDVDLRPLPAGATGGTQVSFAVLQFLEVPLTDLPTLVVFGR